VSTSGGDAVPFQPSYFVRGLPGHPLHPPLTDAAIGAYTVAAVCAVLDYVDVSDTTAAHAWWIALLVGLVFGTLAALTGFADWLLITRGTPLWRTATSHGLAMIGATVFLGLAALFGHDDWQAGDVATGELVLTLVGFVVLAVGGWIGGAIVFVYGMRVLGLADEPTARAIAPFPHPEKEEAAE
jgi:uncharacterized membrane protein